MNIITINDFKHYLKNIYSNIRQHRNSNNTTISIAFLGPKGTYSYFATLTYIKKFFFKKKFFNISCSNFTELFFYMEKNIINFAVVPIENNCSGTIIKVNNLLKNSSLRIHYEFEISIKHCLITYTKKCNINNIREIFSHAEPFKQCSLFINQYPLWKKHFCKSTAAAIKKISIFKSENFAAIGNRETAEFYNLNVIKTHPLSNKINNKTKFLVLKK
ncbi:prephenate dehydratase domain-containing protein [Enterobacteriaceae endosymbiont of Plateumaris consimilis]|uniref:prephenate dehydratase domain-containing protein n=1 Tax=Enterobacteriaceae endosymbiont of Plateumaris consimilis TaxID=2675794 RepID=UPI001470737B|nr:prephenate dehydratase domain-containing protein [Enterobacteriaceae endosymbiont of Plateumaris consimilis]